MTLVVNALCLEGMARSLVPQYNVIDAAQPLLVAYDKLPRPVFVGLLPLLRVFKTVGHTHQVMVFLFPI